MKFEFPARRWVALAGLLALWHAPVWAGRPFATEDAGVIAKGVCEVEAFMQRLRLTSRLNETGLSAQLGCGVIGGTQLAFALAQSRLSGETARAMLFSGKTQLVDGGENKPSFALAYAMQRDRAPNESWRSGATSVNAVVTAPVREWLVHLNLGVTAERAPSRNVTGWALAFERLAVAKGVDAGFEFFGDDRNTGWAQVAGRWHYMPEKLLFDASLGRQMSGGDANRMTVGLKWIFLGA